MIELIHIFLIHKHFTEIILMLLFILMIIILIIIIGLVVRYIYVQAHILSSREFRKTAEKKSAKIRIKNPEITCDYCGCVINTAKEKKCPNCGAVYGDDKELKDRYKVDEVAIEKMANVAAQEAVSKAHKRGLETLKHLRIAIIAFVVALILIEVYFITADRKVSSNTTIYRYDEDVKNNDYSEYTLIDSPEVTILEQDGVTLKLNSVYADTTNGKNNNLYSYRVGFVLKNKRRNPVTLYLKCVGINGRAKSRDYIYIGSHFKDHSEVTFYENVYGEWFDSIDEIVVGECSLSDENGKIYENNKMKTFKLNDKGYTVITDDKDMGSVIFENEEIRIRCLEQNDRHRNYDLWIENLSENNYYINASDMKVDGMVVDSYILYKAGIPAGYTLHHDSVNGLGELFDNRAGDAKVEVSFSFSDPVDPSNDFSTGYITFQ